MAQVKSNSQHLDDNTRIDASTKTSHPRGIKGNKWSILMLMAWQPVGSSRSPTEAFGAIPVRAHSHGKSEWVLLSEKPPIQSLSSRKGGEVERQFGYASTGKVSARRQADVSLVIGSKSERCLELIRYRGLAGERERTQTGRTVTCDSEPPQALLGGKGKE